MYGDLMGNTSNTRQRIVEAAATLIEEHGESAVRIKDLAELVGVTQPSLYHHFANREAVLEAAHLHLFIAKQSLHVAQFNANTHACTTLDEFVQVISDFFDFAHTSASQPIRETRITVMAGALRRPSLMEAVKENLESLATQMVEALTFAQQHQWISQELDLVAFTYWLMGELTTLVFAESTGRIDLRPAVSNLIRSAVSANLGLLVKAPL